MANNSEFSGEILVASRIVDYLSSGLYEKPSSCLKELVNNSYDADATEVNLYIKPDADRIIIEDNGRGMDKADFEKHFSKISESHKRDDSDHTASGRPKIGKIGIGFIAANEVCDTMDIISTKEGSTELLNVTINFEMMRQAAEIRKRSDDDLAKADYTGRIGSANKEEHYTKIFLKNIRGESQAILAGVGTSKYTNGKYSLYGLNADSIFMRLAQDPIKSWSDFDPYSRNLLEIGLNVPVEYHPNWLPPGLTASMVDLVKKVSGFNFKLWIDGSPIYKPIIFSPDGKSMISEFKFSGSKVSGSGYFFAQHTAINPQNLQGILLRIRNAAIGEYDSTFMNYSSSINPLIQKWISAEIYVDDQLEEAMNIDRKTLRIAHPAYVELQQAVHEQFNSFSKKVRNQIYGESSTQRKAVKAETVKRKINEVIEDDINELTPQVTKVISEAWQLSSSDTRSQKNILKRYTVSDFYEIVIEVAKDILSEDQFGLFIEKLTKRLNK